MSMDDWLDKMIFDAKNLDWTFEELRDRCTRAATEQSRLELVRACVWMLHKSP